MYEALSIENNISTTRHSRIMMASEKFLTWIEINEKLDELEKQMNSNNAVKIKKALTSVLEGYCIDSTS